MDREYCKSCGAALGGYPSGNPTHWVCPVALWGEKLDDVLAGLVDLRGHAISPLTMVIPPASEMGGLYNEGDL